MNRRSAKLSTNHFRSKFILRPSFRSKFILRPSWSTKFILRFDFLDITVRHEIGKRYRLFIAFVYFPMVANMNHLIRG